MSNQPSAYAAGVPAGRGSEKYATDPASEVTCRKEAQAPDRATAEETFAVPVPAVWTMNGDRLPDSKLSAITDVPGYGSVGAAVAG
jgi:hypothetical protein